MLLCTFLQENSSALPRSSDKGLILKVKQEKPDPEATGTPPKDTPPPITPQGIPISLPSPQLPAGFIPSSAVATLLQFVKSDPQLRASFGKGKDGSDPAIPLSVPPPLLPIPHIPSLAAHCPPPPPGMPLPSQVHV